MRLRNIPEAKSIVSESSYVIQETYGSKLDLSSCFAKEADLSLEIGTGKGKFLIEMSKRRPGRNFLGVERYESVLFRACEALEPELNKDIISDNAEALRSDETPGSYEKQDDNIHAPIGNLRFLCIDARKLPALLPSDSVSTIYLNFSDPWPKKRHAKRRLTSGTYLTLYESFLKDGGTLEFKTDNRELFAFSEEELALAPFWTVKIGRAHV